MIAQFLQDNGVPQMADSGRVQVGKDADITICDPNTVNDNGTMKKEFTLQLHPLRRGKRHHRSKRLERAEGCTPGIPIYGAVKKE